MSNHIRCRPTARVHHNPFHLPRPETVELNDEKDAARAQLFGFVAQLRAAQSVGMSLVYGVIRAEAPVLKVGMSKQIAGKGGRLARMPGVTLVAITPGGRDEERQVHQRLAKHRLKMMLRGQGHGEHFALCDDVLEWVNETRHAMNLDSLALDPLLSQYGV